MIKVAVAGAVALYVFCLVMAAAGFTSIVPFIVVVPVLVLLVGGGNLLGGRNHGRTRGAVPPGFNPAPVSSSGPNGPLPTARADGAPGDPRAGGENAIETGGPPDAAPAAGGTGTADGAPAGDGSGTEGGGDAGDHG